MIKVVLFVTRFPPLHAILRWMLEINNSLLTKTLTRQTVLNKVHDFVVTLTKDRAIETARVKQEPSLAKLVLCRRLETWLVSNCKVFFNDVHLIFVLVIFKLNNFHNSDLWAHLSFVVFAYFCVLFLLLYPLFPNVIKILAYILKRLRVMQFAC